MTATLWAFLPPDQDGQISACVVSEAAAVVHRGLLEECLGHDIARSVAVIPGLDAALARLPLPKGTHLQMQTAGRLMMQDVVAAKSAELLTGIARRTDDDNLRWVAQCPPATCQHALDALAPYGIAPDIVTLAASLLPAPSKGCVTADYMGIQIAKTQTRGFAAEPDVMAMILEAQDPIEILTEQAFEAAIVSASQDLPDFNLRIGSLAKASASDLKIGWFKRSALFAVCAACLWPIVPAVDGIRYRSAVARLDAETRVQVKDALPNAPRIVNARAQLEERMQALGLRGGGERLLGLLITSLSQTNSPVVEALRYTPREGLSVTLIIADEDQLESLAQRLRRGGVTADTSAIRITRDGPRADIVIKAQQ